MSQIYKVAHLKNNEIVILYVFYGSKIGDTEYESTLLENRFKADKNDELFKQIFTDELLNKIIEDDSNIIKRRLEKTARFNAFPVFFLYLANILNIFLKITITIPT